MKQRRMRFLTWAKQNPDDESKIVYTFRTKEFDGAQKTMRFTSEDVVPWSMLDRIREAWIESIDRIDDVWYVVIYED